MTTKLRKKTSFSLSFSAFEEPLQFAAVLFMTSSFIFGHTIGIVLSIYVLLTPLYGFMVVYLLWTYCFDLGTPSKGGRRSDTFRRLKSWEYFRDYFSAKLIRTKRLDPKRNYILGYHPHGIMCAGAWVNFATEATGFSNLFPGIKSHLLTLKRKWNKKRIFLVDRKIEVTWLAPHGFSRACSSTLWRGQWNFEHLFSYRKHETSILCTSLCKKYMQL